MTWIAAIDNPLLVTLTGPFGTIVADATPMVRHEAVSPMGDIQTMIGNPLSIAFTRAIEVGRPVEGGGSARPTSGLVYPRKT